MRFKLSSSAVIEVRRQGIEQQPVIVIDHALDDAAALIDSAASLAFTPIGPYYPGVRALPDDEFRDDAARVIGGLVRERLNVESAAWSIDCFYSLATTPPDELAPIQRFPHYDGVEDNRIAALLFLCEPKFGGTAFYRHLATGFETVDGARFSEFKQALEAEVREKGLPPAAYIDDGAPFFAKISEFDAAPNRMLIYRGKTLHCSAIKSPELLSSHPRRGRLTVNYFLSPNNGSR